MNTSITSKQLEQVATFTADAARMGARTAMERITQSSSASKDELQKKVIEKGDELTKFVSEKIAGLLEGKLLEMLMIMLGHLKVLMAGSVTILAMPRMEVADCLKRDGKIIGGRDSDLDNYLSSHVPEMSGGTINCFELTKPEGTKFRQMAEAVLSMAGSDADLKKALRERGMTFHLQQVRDLIVRTENGENTGLHKDGKANLFFIEDEKGEIFGLFVRRRVDWSSSVYCFGSGSEWRQGCRFFSRNTPAQAGKA